MHVLVNKTLCDNKTLIFWVEFYEKVDDFNAVSYTHLDVYKRQVIYSIQRKSDKSTSN